MQLIVNGENVQVADGATIAVLLAQKGLNPANVVVEYNQDIVKQEQWRDIVLKPGDKLEIVTFVGGG